MERKGKLKRKKRRPRNDGPLALRTGTMFAPHVLPFLVHSIQEGPKLGDRAENLRSKVSQKAARKG